jgi:hypothetical protein
MSCIFDNQPDSIRRLGDLEIVRELGRGDRQIQITASTNPQSWGDDGLLRLA